MRLVIFLFLFWTVLSGVVLTIIVVTSKYVARLFEPHSVIPQLLEDDTFPSTLTFAIAISLAVVVAVSISLYMSRSFQAAMKYHPRVKSNWGVFKQSVIWSTAASFATTWSSESIAYSLIVGACLGVILLFIMPAFE